MGAVSRTVMVCACACAWLGCSDDGRSQTGSNEAGIGSLSSSGTDSGIGEVVDEGPKLDLPGDGDDDNSGAGDEAGSDGCKKVDFLFVVDSSP
jgi:hypothetical protein